MRNTDYGTRIAEHGLRNTDYGTEHGTRNTEHGTRNTERRDIVEVKTAVLCHPSPPTKPTNDL
jgi:hypothetical protein